MTQFTKLPGAATLSLLALVVSFTAAASAEPLSVSADQSRIITMDRAPGTVVVGNPSIADVTIQGNQLFVHGRVWGKTNVIVLDEGGNQLAEYSINVVRDDEYDVVLYRGTAKESFTCKTDCESVFQIGDHLDYYKLINEQQNNKIGIAQGQKPGDKQGSESAPAQ